MILFHHRRYRTFDRSAAQIRRDLKRDGRGGVLLFAVIAAVGLAVFTRLGIPTSWAGGKVPQPEGDLPNGSSAVVGLRIEGAIFRPGGQPMTESEFVAAWEDVEKVPPLLRRVLLADSPLELLSGKSVIDHPRYVGKSGGFPGRPGYSWSDIVGIAEHDATIVLVNQNLAARSQGQSLVLHEIAHQFDRHCGRPSADARWLAIHTKAPWERQYAARFPAEGFADAWAAYFYSSSARTTLPAEVREYIHGLVHSRKWLEGANLDAEAMPSIAHDRVP